MSRGCSAADEVYPLPKFKFSFFNFQENIARQVSDLDRLFPTKRASFSYQTGGLFPPKRADVSYQMGVRSGAVPNRPSISYQTGGCRYKLFILPEYPRRNRQESHHAGGRFTTKRAGYGTSPTKGTGYLLPYLTLCRGSVTTFNG